MGPKTTLTVKKLAADMEKLGGAIYDAELDGYRFGLVLIFYTSNEGMACVEGYEAESLVNIGDIDEYNRAITEQNANSRIYHERNNDIADVIMKYYENAVFKMRRFQSSANGVGAYAANIRLELYTGEETLLYMDISGKDKIEIKLRAPRYADDGSLNQRTVRRTTKTFDVSDFDELHPSGNFINWLENSCGDEYMQARFVDGAWWLVTDLCYLYRHLFAHANAPVLHAFRTEVHEKIVNDPYNVYGSFFGTVAPIRYERGFAFQMPKDYTPI